MIRLPGDSHRTTIVGKTGSGKTFAGAWHLSRRHWERKPWVIYDFKGDELLNELGAEEIDVSFVPKKPGLYIVHPIPDAATNGVEDMMWKIWERENVGIYVDEGYMIGMHNRAFNTILTQGRSKRIPAIVLSQRPTWMTSFVWSESEFFQLFFLNDVKDRKRVMEFVPANVDERLPEFYSYYYDVGKDKLVVLSPVPDHDSIVKAFQDRNPNKRTVI